MGKSVDQEHYNISAPRLTIYIENAQKNWMISIGQNAIILLKKVVNQLLSIIIILFPD